VSIVRENLLKDRGYTPYCGGKNCPCMPRTEFKRDQFECGTCGWRSTFEPEFIEQVKAVRAGATK
jgi:hypothetical protein